MKVMILSELSESNTRYHKNNIVNFKILYLIQKKLKFLKFL